LEIKVFSLGIGVEGKGILPGDDIVESLGVKGVGVFLGERVSGYFNSANLQLFPLQLPHHY